MPDTITTIDAATGQQTTRPLTTGEKADLTSAGAEADAAALVVVQREQRRKVAIDRLNAYVTMGAGATAAQVRTESQFVAKVLAKVLPFLDIDPG